MKGFFIAIFLMVTLVLVVTTIHLGYVILVALNMPSNILTEYLFVAIGSVLFSVVAGMLKS